MLIASHPQHQAISAIEIDQICQREKNSEFMEYSLRLKSLSPDELQNKRLTKASVAYNINKYLEPIAAVLEYVLTSGGDEIIEQIDN